MTTGPDDEELARHGDTLTSRHDSITAHYRPVNQERNSMTHTPGPWTVDVDDVASDRRIVMPNPHRPGMRMTGATLYGFNESENAEANARLMAAAPELLEALQDMAILAKSQELAWTPQYEAARTAIQKATNG